MMRRAGGFNPKSAATITAALEVANEDIVPKEAVRVWPALPDDVDAAGVEEGKDCNVPLTLDCRSSKTVS